MFEFQVSQLVRVVAYESSFSEPTIVGTRGMVQSVTDGYVRIKVSPEHVNRSGGFHYLLLKPEEIAPIHLLPLTQYPDV